MHKLDCLKKIIRSRADWSQVCKIRSFPTWIKIRKQRSHWLWISTTDQSTVFDAIYVFLQIKCSLHLITCVQLQQKWTCPRVFSEDFHHTLSFILCRTAVFKEVSLRRPSMTASVSGKHRRWEDFYKIAVLHLHLKQLKNVSEGVQFLVKLQASGLKLYSN